jgi:hypothetical protein
MDQHFELCRRIRVTLSLLLGVRQLSLQLVSQMALISCSAVGILSEIGAEAYSW